VTSEYNSDDINKTSTEEDIEAGESFQNYTSNESKSSKSQKNQTHSQRADDTQKS